MLCIIKTDAEALMRKYFFVKKEMSNCVTNGRCVPNQPATERRACFIFILFSSFHVSQREDFDVCHMILYLDNEIEGKMRAKESCDSSHFLSQVVVVHLRMRARTRHVLTFSLSFSFSRQTSEMNPERAVAATVQ